MPMLCLKKNLSAAAAALLLVAPVAVTAGDLSPHLTRSDLCKALPPPTSQCQIFTSWDDFSEALFFASGELILCAGSWLTKPATDRNGNETPPAVIKKNLRLGCTVPGKCIIRGPGRHINIKTGIKKRVIIHGIEFRGSDFTSVAISDYASGLHTFCDNTFIGNSRNIDSPKGGGAILAGIATNLVVMNSVFKQNEAKAGGAISFAGDSLSILDSRFENNVAVQGGAVESSTPATGSGTPGRLEIGGSTFLGNMATDDGGASSAILVTSGEDWIDLGGNSAVDAGCNGAYARAAGSYDPARCFDFTGGVGGSGSNDGGAEEEEEEVTDITDSSDSHDGNPANYEEEVALAQPPQEPEAKPEPTLSLGKGLYRDRATNLQVAEGLKVRSFAKTFRPVQYRNGQNSGTCDFMMNPDGAAAFYDERHNEDGGFHYCINSESKYSGGVSCIEFDANCEVIDYKNRIGGREDDGCAKPNWNFIENSYNCNGGSTPWNSWVTCEEIDVDDGGGYCWQVDPYGERQPERVDRIGAGEWEAMAVDDRTSQPIFYFTEDWGKGALRQFTPSPSTLPAGWHSLHGDGELRYLVFNNDNTFYWSSNEKEGRKSQSNFFPNVEGITFMEIDGSPYLFFVSKKRYRLFRLNLDTGVYTSSPTDNNDEILRDGGAFWSGPDIIVPLGSHFIFHSEDGGGTPGVYFKDLRTNEYLTVFQDDDPILDEDGDYDDETTGVAVSPHGKCLLSCLQKRGECFIFEREDGGSFETLTPRLRIR